VFSNATLLRIRDREARNTLDIEAELDGQGLIRIEDRQPGPVCFVGMRIRNLRIVKRLGVASSVTGLALAASCESTPAYVGFDALPCLPDPARHDEDGDGFPDSCDVCPAVVDPRQLDTGEMTVHAFPDGVGDACDLSLLAGDDLVVLHTFAAGSTTKWTGSGWTVANDSASVVGPAEWTANKAERGDGLVVHVRAATWESTSGHIQIVTDGTGGTRGLLCSLFRDRDADGLDELEAMIHGVPTVKQVPQVHGELALTAWRYVDTSGDGCLYCEHDRAGKTFSVTMPRLGRYNTGRYMLSVGEGTLSISSVAVYTQPVNPCRDRGRCPSPDTP